MRITVIAPAKSGSSAVYRGIKNGLQAHEVDKYTYGFFEPQTYKPLQKLRINRFNENLVVKSMAARLKATNSSFHLDWFHKRILLTRDIKDMLVSELLFRPMIAPITDEQFNFFVDLISEKEKNPHSLSVIKMHKMCDEMKISRIDWNTYRDILSWMIKIDKEFNCFKFKYEDFCVGNTSDLSAYLGCDLNQTDLEGSWLSHIKRKGGAGEWLKWFTKEDYEFVHSFFADYNTYFNYDEQPDFVPNTTPISPEFGSEYVKKRYVKRTQDFSVLNGNVQDYNEEDLRTLVTRARDGGLGSFKQIESYMQSSDNLLLSQQEFDHLKYFYDILESE